MNFLEATNQFLWETGLADQITTLVDEQDDVLQAAQWVAKSWIHFQVSRLWRFRWSEGAIDVTNGTTSYNATALGLNVGDAIIRGSYYNSGANIESLSFIDLRKVRRAGASADTTRVLKIAAEPGPVLETYPDVDTTQSVNFDYWRGALEVTVDADEFTGLPSDWHMLIVHLALTNYGQSIAGEEGSNTYAHHGGKYADLYKKYVTFAGEDNKIPPIRNSLL